ncbi:MAG: arginase family protein [Candidatus Methanomethyliaceae archaeon]|nr:arginase family protein [Candidatus Methanomethyliaceae archaeon]
MVWSAFGALFDPDEGRDSIQRKIEEVIKGIRPANPYRAVLCSEEVVGLNIRDCGEVPIESWLSIYPVQDDLFMLTSANFGIFLDSDGCREYKEKVREYARGLERPLMIGGDHSLTGGVVEALIDKYEDLLLVVLDSHFDGIPSPIRNELIGYMMESRPDYERFGYKPSDYVFSSAGRKNSYNGGSFLYHLINEGIINAENVVVFGPLDYPTEKMERIQDHRVKEFVQTYKALENEGVKIVHRGIIDSLGLEKVINDCVGPKFAASNIYISVDLDIGSRSALMGAKFTDIEGLKEASIYMLLRALYKNASNIIGLDLMEIDPWRAGLIRDGVKDRTYNICGNIIRILTDGNIYLQKRYKEVLEKISPKTMLKEIGDKKLLDELINMGFLELSGKYLNVLYDGEVLSS